MSHTTITAQREPFLAPHSARKPAYDIIVNRLWIEEHEWFYARLKSEHNALPTYRFPDLINACVTLIFPYDNAAAGIFDFLRAELVLRAPHGRRRRDDPVPLNKSVTPLHVTRPPQVVPSRTTLPWRTPPGLTRI